MPHLFDLRYVRPLRARPRLLSAIGVGILAAVVLAIVPVALPSTTRAPIAWDAGCLWFIALVLKSFFGSDPDRIRKIAARMDEGQGLILTLALLLATASLAAVAVELAAAKDAHGLEKAIRIALGFGTVASSWLVVQLIFALHYAHEYYAPDDDDDPQTKERGGLNFPGDTRPDYWDFLHFAIVIGVASQTADITFTAQRLRRIGTVHSIVSFVFNAAILGLTINIVAGLFS